MSVTITVCLHSAVLATSGESYAEAFKATNEEGCPLVVMVGATWCPACQEMKRTVIPEVKRQGILQKVAFAHVDLDEEQELGKRLIDGRPVPQLLMFRKTAQGWKLRRPRLRRRQPVAEPSLCSPGTDLVRESHTNGSGNAGPNTGRARQIEMP